MPMRPSTLLTPENHHPQIALAPSPNSPGTWHLDWDFGAKTPPRSTLKSHRDLSLPSQPSLPVTLKATKDGVPLLVVDDTSHFPSWAKRLLPGHFNFRRRSWRVDHLVLAAMGVNTEEPGLEVEYLDGDPLHVVFSNLVVTNPSRERHQAIQAMAALATVPDGHSREDHRGYVRLVLRELLKRYPTLRIATTIKQAVVDSGHPAPYFEAKATVVGPRRRGENDTCWGIAGGTNAEDAVFFAELEALRQLLFYGEEVAYCGVLYKGRRITVTLLPQDLPAGRYTLRIDIDHTQRPHAWELSQRPGLEARLKKDTYELGVHLDTRQPEHRTRYLRLTGSIDPDIKVILSKRIKLTTVRLHTLLKALEAEERHQSPPELDGHTHHVHHRLALGYQNRIAWLQQTGAVEHAQIHFEWADSPEATVLSTRGVAAQVVLPPRTIHGEWYYDYTPDRLHSLISLALRPVSAPPGPSRPPASLVSPSPQNSRQDAIKHQFRILQELRKAGGALDRDTLFRLTSLPRATGYRHLKRLSSEGRIMLHQDHETDQVVIQLLENPFDDPPRPRKPHASRKA